ncbi:MAG: pyridoxamine 5'-phosphate oxidase family protein [Spirochaetes bacterium]|nr:MAG: pyridoxamine 5'-phosphate oxidase family protein [Spirochaetota bacterium]
MRRLEREITDRRVIDRILNEALVCRIGLCDGETPYVVPMNFGYDGKSLFFHSAPIGRKIEIISRNDRVCFEVDTDHQMVRAAAPCGWGMKYRSVIGSGRARLLPDGDEKMEALSCIMRKYGAEGELRFEEKSVRAVAVIRVDIEEIRGKQAGQ